VSANDLHDFTDREDTTQSYGSAAPAGPQTTFSKRSPSMSNDPTTVALPQASFNSATLGVGPTRSVFAGNLIDLPFAQAPALNPPQGEPAQVAGPSILVNRLTALDAMFAASDHAAPGGGMLHGSDHSSNELIDALFAQDAPAFGSAQWMNK